MNKLNSLTKLAISGIATIAATGITTVPAQAVGEISTLEWSGLTSDFIDEATDAFNSGIDSTFEVSFSPDEFAAIIIASGHFAPFFPTVPPVDVFPVTSGPVSFRLTAFEPPLPGTTFTADFELEEDLIFNFDTPVSEDLVIGSLGAGATFAGELLETGAVEFELETGVFIIDQLPDNPETPEFDPKFNITSESSIFEFGQTVGSEGGGYIAETTDIKVPEPASILGLLAVGGLGLGLKGKKKS